MEKSLKKYRKEITKHIELNPQFTYKSGFTLKNSSNRGISNQNMRRSENIQTKPSRSSSTEKTNYLEHKIIPTKLIETTKEKLIEDIGNIFGVQAQRINESFKLPDWREKNRAFKDFKHIRHGLNLTNNPRKPIKKSTFS